MFPVNNDLFLTPLARYQYVYSKFLKSADRNRQFCYIFKRYEFVFGHLVSDNNYYLSTKSMRRIVDAKKKQQANRQTDI